MNILITGANGFLGQNLQRIMQEQCKFTRDLSCDQFLLPDSKEFDLLNEKSINEYMMDHDVDMIVHMAALAGGIGLNNRKPADLTHINLKMTVNMFDIVRNYKIKHFIGIGSVCSYPKYCPVPFSESDLWNGRSEYTNEGYGEAKKMMIAEFQSHKKQYGLNGCILMPTNLYGFYDHFDLENSHVIPALINKFVNAKENHLPEVKCFGTGIATRDLLFAFEAAEAILLAIDKRVDFVDPINLGSGSDIMIKDLANTISELVEYEGDIVFDGKLDGQPKRLLDISRAKEILGWESKINLKNGLKEVIDWYKKECVK